MRTRLMTMAVLAMTGALTINAQTPQRPPEQQPPRPPEQQGDTTQRTGADQKAQVVTVTGCLKAEKDAPGARPNVESAAITEDYILTEVKMSQSSATSGIGLAPKYDVEGIADAELQKHVNHQVEIVGTLSRGDAQGNRGAAAAPGSAAAANANIPQLFATSVKMISATCTAAQ
jgi:hypothetical protein